MVNGLYTEPVDIEIMWRFLMKNMFGIYHCHQRIFISDEIIQEVLTKKCQIMFTLCVNVQPTYLI